jgi:SAM-dependent methyltransferase
LLLQLALVRRCVIDPETTAATQASYDRVAEAYAERFFHELDAKPLDRALLDCFAEQVRGQGTVADLGCGPGQIARYLHERGIPMVGIDLAPAMVALARRLSPRMEFRQGTMLALDALDEAWAGIIAFYSIIHIPPADLPCVCGEFHRVLAPGGPILLSFHVGQELHHTEEMLGQPVALDAQFYLPETLEHALQAAGFTVEARLVRQPYTEIEHPSQRGYLFARKR